MTYRVALEVDMEDLPSDVRSTVSSAIACGRGPRRCAEVPGLLCIVSSISEEKGTHYSWSWWSRLHGYVNGEPVGAATTVQDVVRRLERVEHDFLPFVLEREKTSAVRVKTGGPGLERWLWWPGKSVEDMHDFLTAALVMET